MHMLAAFPIPINAFQSQLHPLGVVKKWAHTQNQMEPTKKDFLIANTSLWVKRKIK